MVYDDNTQMSLYHTHRRGCDNGNVDHHTHEHGHGNDNVDHRIHDGDCDDARDGGHALLPHHLPLLESKLQKWLLPQNQKARYLGFLQKAHRSNRSQLSWLLAELHE